MESSLIYFHQSALRNFKQNYTEYVAVYFKKNSHDWLATIALQMSYQTRTF